MYMAGKKQCKQRDCGSANYASTPEPAVYSFSTQFANPYDELNRGPKRQKIEPDAIPKQVVRIGEKEKEKSNEIIYNNIRIQPQNRPISEFEKTIMSLQAPNKKILAIAAENVSNVKTQMIGKLKEELDDIVVENHNENITDALTSSLPKISAMLGDPELKNKMDKEMLTLIKQVENKTENIDAELQKAAIVIPADENSLKIFLRDNPQLTKIQVETLYDEFLKNAGLLNLSMLNNDEIDEFDKQRAKNLKEIDSVNGPKRK